MEVDLFPEGVASECTDRQAHVVSTDESGIADSMGIRKTHTILSGSYAYPYVLGIP